MLKPVVKYSAEMDGLTDKLIPKKHELFLGMYVSVNYLNFQL
jgi:hypothetical protein